MIRVLVGALADQELDGIIRPVRADLSPVSAAGRDLLQRAGEAMALKLAALESLPLGGAVLTPGGLLPAEFVIHAVVATDDEPETVHSARRALQNALRRASDLGLGSLALPPLGMGVGILEGDEAARSMVEVLFDHLDAGLAPLELIVVVANEYEAEVFQRAVDEVGRDRFPMRS